MSLNVFKWLLKKAGIITFPLLILIAVNAALSVIGVNFSLISKDAVDIAAGQAEGSLLSVFVRLGLLLLLQVVLIAGGSALDAVVKGRFEIKIKRELFTRLLKKDWLTLSGYHSGELLNRLNSDAGIVITGMCDIIPQFISFAITIVLSAYYLFVLAPGFALYILPLGPVVLIFGRFYSRKVKKLHKKCLESDGRTRSFMQEMLQNVIAVKSFSAEDAAARHSEQFQKINYKFKIKRSAVSIFASIGLYILFTFGYYSALAWGSVKISYGTLTYGTLVAMLRLVSQIQGPFRSMSSLLSQAFATFASAERIIELENLKEEKINIDYFKKYGKINRVCLKNVSFSYDKALVLDGADLIVNNGDFVAVSGVSGIGKSTLLKLLLGLVEPDEGEIFIDCDEKISVSPKTRLCFSYVPQENMILSGTIRDNIAFYREVSDDKINEVAKLSCVDEFAIELPLGLDTELKEGGSGLSGGQIQRIAIARALVSDAPFLLFDEATSALDEETEKKVLHNLRSFTDKGCIIVSHKPAAIDICDKIIRIENGKFISDGV